MTMYNTRDQYAAELLHYGYAQMKPKKEFIVYFIYGGETVLYVGRTSQPLSRRLRGHFDKTRFQRHIDVLDVDRVRYITLPTQADMFLYEIYFINVYKPPYNLDDKADDYLTVKLPRIDRQTWGNLKLLEKWKAEARKIKEMRKKYIMETISQRIGQ